MKQLFKKLSLFFICVLLVINCIPVFATAASAYTPPTNLPAMYINLDGNFPQNQIDKETYRSGKISIVGADGYSDIIDAVGAMKGRGNYSWSAEKKPYNIKFDSKTDVLGMGKAKKWVLIANYWDKTLLRNYITLKMASDLGLAYTPEVRFIDLYVNGIYRGNYLLTEKIEIGSQRIDIDDENGGVLFEIEQQYRHNDCTYCYQTASGVHLTYKEPEFEGDGPGDVFNTQFIQNMMNTTNPILDKVDSSLSKGYSEYSKYIDIDSFVNWYIVNEFCKNYDSQFVTSCYCYYDPADKLLHMGPVWDYDTCYGNQAANGYGVPEGYLISEGSPWYRILTRDSNFMNLVKNRWTELKAEGKIFQVLQNVIEGADYIAQSQALNNTAWPRQLLDGGPRGDSSQTYYTYKEELDYLKKFIAKRAMWLDGQWNTAPDTAVNKLDNINMLAYGLFINNNMTVESTYFEKAYELYASLTPAEAATIPNEVVKMFDDYEVYAVESAITNAKEITSYSQRGIVEQARRLYNSLPEEKKGLVSNYADLLSAEEKVLALAAELGIANVMKNDVTARVVASSVSGKAGYHNESFDKIFDGLTSTKYCVSFSDPISVQWDMTIPTEVEVYAIATANDSPGRNPNEWILEGSNDKNNWTIVDTVTNAGLSQEPYKYKEFFCDTAGVYQYYRITFTKVAGKDGNLQFSEILLGGAENEAVANVIDVIDALGEVTDLSKKPEVEAARALYDALSAVDKICVTNYSDLLNAEIAIINLSGNKTAINQVIDLITSIPDTLTVNDEQTVVLARNKYDLLSEAERTFISNYEKLTAAEATLLTLKEVAADKAEAKLVDNLIAAIGEVTSKEKKDQIEGARAAYNALTDKQKKYVEKLFVLIAAEKALALLDAVPNTIDIIASIHGTVTYSDGPVIHKAREMYDALSAGDKLKVTNYSILTSAEAALQQIYDQFAVGVHLSTQGKDTFTKTPWMDINKLTEEQKTATTDAMADELWYQYYAKGYQLGITKGYYEISNHGGYFILQSDVRYFDGTLTGSDNVGNPWGTEGRYWSCIIAPFSGMAFSVNGYLSASTYGYEMPLCNPFLYDGRVYQVYSTGVKYFIDTPLVKDTSPAFATFEYYPGSGDGNNNNTLFIYAYAKYSQENKWNGKVIGVPYGDVQYTADNTVLYQRFYSADGDAYIAASRETVNKAVAESGNPTGAYSITDEMLDSFITLGDSDEARFAITGAPVSDSEIQGDLIYQQFEKGTLVYSQDGQIFFMNTDVFHQSFANAEKIEKDIADLPEFSSMKKEDFDKAVGLKQKMDALSEFEKYLISSDAFNKLEKALTWKEEEDNFILGDVDGDKKVTVSDVVALRSLIMKGNPSDDALKRGDLDKSDTLTVTDVVALRALIMKGV